MCQVTRVTYLDNIIALVSNIHLAAAILFQYNFFYSVIFCCSVGLRYVTGLFFFFEHDCLNF